MDIKMSINTIPLEGLCLGSKEDDYRILDTRVLSVNVVSGKDQLIEVTDIRKGFPPRKIHDNSIMFLVIAIFCKIPGSGLRWKIADIKRVDS